MAGGGGKKAGKDQQAEKDQVTIPHNIPYARC